MPELIHEKIIVTTFKTKAEMLAILFFPAIIEIDIRDIINTTYLKFITMPKIIKEKVFNFIHKAASFKAPDLDSIPNIILQKLDKLIISVIISLFNNYL